MSSEYSTCRLSATVTPWSPMCARAHYVWVLLRLTYENCSSSQCKGIAVTMQILALITLPRAWCSVYQYGKWYSVYRLLIVFQRHTIWQLDMPPTTRFSAHNTANAIHGVRQHKPRDQHWACSSRQHRACYNTDDTRCPSQVPRSSTLWQCTILFLLQCCNCNKFISVLTIMNNVCPHLSWRITLDVSGRANQICCLWCHSPMQRAMGRGSWTLLAVPLQPVAVCIFKIL